MVLDPRSLGFHLQHLAALAAVCAGRASSWCMARGDKNSSLGDGVADLIELDYCDDWSITFGMLPPPIVAVLESVAPSLGGAAWRVYRCSNIHTLSPTQSAGLYLCGARTIARR